jgi:hypothetical protein
VAWPHPGSIWSINKNSCRRRQGGPGRLVLSAEAWPAISLRYNGDMEVTILITDSRLLCDSVDVGIVAIGSYRTRLRRHLIARTLRRCNGSPRRFRTDSRHNDSIVTRAMPLNPRACAPAGVRSIIRPRMNGPRSFTLTMTDLPLPTFVTRTFVPKGRVRCAAVKARDLTRSPFAVFGPLLAV